MKKIVESRVKSPDDWNQLLGSAEQVFRYFVASFESENVDTVSFPPTAVQVKSGLQEPKGLDCSFPSQPAPIQNANPPGDFQGEGSFHDEARVICSSVEMTSVFMGW